MAEEESEFSLSEEDDGDDSSSSDGALDDDTETNLLKKKKKLTKKGKGEFSCEWSGCGRAFNKPSRLKEHQYSHTGQVMVALFIYSSSVCVAYLSTAPICVHHGRLRQVFQKKSALASPRA